MFNYFGEHSNKYDYYIFEQKKAYPDTIIAFVDRSK